jgi:predicted anti-sigma-YlaC factor YlaD
MRRQMKCHTIEEQLSAYQDGELSVSERGQVERHLAGCHSCREQHVKLQQTWQALGEMAEIRPSIGFYKQVSQQIGQASEKGVFDTARWGGWWVRALPSSALASVILAIGMLCGTYIGNSLFQFEPFNSAVASFESGFLSSLRVFDPAPPGTLADSYERLLSYNGSHTK